jgi:lysophospholipase L1-like esterase
MPTKKRALAALPAIPMAMAGAVAYQVLRAAHRPDLPSFENQNPNGTFGEPELAPLRLVALGDSSITAPGVEDLDNAWVRRIAISLSDEFHVDLVSLAVGGSKARDVIAGQLEDAVRLQPDIAILSVGANDAIRATPPDRYRAELHQIVSELDRTSGAIVVLGVGDLGSIPRLPSLLRPTLTRRAARFNSAAAAIAAQFPNAVKVPTTGPMSTAFWQDRELFADDLFHAGDKGHRLFAEQMLPAFRAALVVHGRTDS